MIGLRERVFGIGKGGRLTFLCKNMAYKHIFISLKNEGLCSTRVPWPEDVGQRAMAQSMAQLWPKLCIIGLLQRGSNQI